MNAFTRYMVISTAISALGSTQLAAQVLHVNDRWKDCAFVIHPSLTQEAWHQFVGEAGVAINFRSLATAKPLGTRHIEVAVLNWATDIDAADPAWNDTFSHPDSTHWLVDEGDPLPIPGLMVRAGVTERIDVGAYFTKNPNANYGVVGAQLQSSLLNDSESGLAAAGRLHVSSLFGPEDLSVVVSGIELVVSRDVSVLSPYLGVSGFLSHGRERTNKVDLDNELIAGIQGTAGLAASISAVRVGAEVSLARRPGYALKVGVGL